MSGPGSATHADPAVLEAVSLVRDYGAVRAVDRVSFRLRAGEFLSVFGPNGAGKTSLLRLLAGGLRPTTGEVRVSGAPLTPGDRAARGRIGILSHLSFLYGRLTARENLVFYGRLHGLGGLGARVSSRLAEVGLERHADNPVDTLSRGTTQRLAVARALLHDPEIVLLDEPYTGLDAYAGAILQELLSGLKGGGRTVVMVTHNLGRGLALADRVAVQVRGRFAFEADRADLDEATLESSYRRAVERGA